MEFNASKPTIEEINNERFLLLIHAFVFVVVFMIIGLFGNGMVIYIYGWRLRKSSIHVLLLLLAYFDMFCCLVALPLQIVEIRLNFIYPCRHLCKLSAFVIFYCCNGSILTLLAICALRYHKVCRFEKRQMSVTQARLAAVFISFLSLPLTIPAVIFFDIKEISIAPGLSARSCLWRDSYEHLWIYFMLMMAFNLSILLVMFVLYGLIWVKIRRQDTFKRTPSDNNQRKPRTKNRIFIGITALYAIGFLPGLLLGVFYPLYKDVILSAGAEVVRNVLYRMWILNCTLNPVIYGFFGLRFREEARNVFKRSFSRTKSECSTSESPH